MRVVFTPHGWEDYTHWQTADRTMIKRINRLIDDARRDPFTGIGKPEQLRHALAGAWSRRITEEHRLVYLVDGDDLVILQARFHYVQQATEPPAQRHEQQWVEQVGGRHPRVVMELLGHPRICTATDTDSHVMPKLAKEAAAWRGTALWS